MDNSVTSSMTTHLDQNTDPCYLLPSDSPRLLLTNVKSNGLNFLNWSRSIKLTLSAKVKLGFLDGTCLKLENDLMNQ